MGGAARSHDGRSPRMTSEHAHDSAVNPHVDNGAPGIRWDAIALLVVGGGRCPCWSSRPAYVAGTALVVGAVAHLLGLPGEMRYLLGALETLPRCCPP
jgi:hypothetical protein